VGKKLLYLTALAVAALLAAPDRDVGRAFAAPTESCVTASCHAGMGKASFVHGPVAVGECAACHKQKKKHKFEPISDVAKLCYECHEELNKQKVVHAPVKAGKCTGCHDPHQSPNKFQLRASGSGLCFRCHDKAIAEGAFVHGPAAVGGCAACHNPHQSENPKLLPAAGNQVCFACHADKAEAFKGRKFVHAPVRDACVNCHSPHKGGHRYNLSAEADRDLCFTCHPDKEKDIKEATVPHKGLDTPRKCLACHDPHVSDYVKQLVSEPAQLCLGCHDRQYGGQNGGVANMKEFLEGNTDHHGPIRQNDCSSCHNTHGSGNFRMLREFFPRLFYAGYSRDNYRLCFMCHEQTLADDEKTATLTKFRNGDHNLHFVHVNKAVKGRTCRACHDAHATNNPRHIRDAVPFGSWQLPVGFTKTETGGQCLSGCHQRFSYDRQKPVANKP
jgi:predicted CXXCH cytochrome family protein